MKISTCVPKFAVIWRCSLWLVCVLAWALAGCKKEKIEVYTAPKEAPPPAPQEQQPQTAAAHETEAPPPHLSWKLPEGWKEGVPNEISMASFHVYGADGKDADVSITRLGHFAGKETVLVNMWRSRVGQKEIGEEEARQQLHPVEVAGGQGSLFEVSGEGTEGPAKIVTAMLHRPDGSWFFKLSGDAAVVESQKSKFTNFLQTIHIESAAADEPAKATAAGAGGQFHWQVPAGWKEEPAGEMQVARFAVAGNNQATAEVFVSVFPTDTGGTVANVNRWRRQLGLDQIEERDLSTMVKALDPANPGAVVVDMTKDRKRLLGSIVPRDGQYWFYKILGDTEVVGAEKDSFLAFAKSRP